MKIEVCDTCYRLGVFKPAHSGPFCSTHKETNAKARAYLDLKDRLENLEEAAALFEDDLLLQYFAEIKGHIDAEVGKLSA